MAKTRLIVVLLAIIAAVGVGAAIGSMAGGSKQPIANWTPPGGTPQAPTTTPESAIIVPTLIPTTGIFSTPGLAQATFEPSPVFITIPTGTATPQAAASPEASPSVASPVATAVTPIVPTTTIGSFNQLTPTGP